MKSRLLPFIAAFLLVFAIAGPVSAYDHTNLAGRPISGNAGTGQNTTGCMGTIYGKVAGNMVLFTARHCNSHDNFGGWVKAPNGTRLGFWANNQMFTANETNYNNVGQYDMTWIELDIGQRPFVKNQIYRGAVAGDDFWTITDNFPPVSMRISANFVGHTVYRMQQEVVGGVKGFVTSTVNSAPASPVSSNLNLNMISDNCIHTGIDSGAPFMKYVSSGVYKFLGTGTAAWGPYCWADVNKYNVSSNWYQAIRDLNTWVNTYYPGTGGAYFCADADCT